MSEDKAYIRITNVVKVEEGKYQFDYEISKNFREVFKREYGLKRWSQKRFEKWLAENAEELVGAQKK
jgi:hypothetical protein